jgi:hypothetical protein
MNGILSQLCGLCHNGLAEFWIPCLAPGGMDNKPYYYCRPCMDSYPVFIHKHFTRFDPYEWESMFTDEFQHLSKQ